MTVYNLQFQVTAFSSIDTVPLGSPQNLSAVPVDSTTLLITWMPPLASLQNGIIRNYKLSVTETETTTTTLFTLNDVLSHTVRDLHPFYNYEVRMAAVTVGDGPFSDLVGVQLPESCTLTAIHVCCDMICF